MSRTTRRKKTFIILADGTCKEIKKKRNVLSRHHLVPKERVKLKTVPTEERCKDFNRVLMLWRDKHDIWHKLFHNMTLGEIMAVLQRIDNFKQGKR